MPLTDSQIPSSITLPWLTRPGALIFPRVTAAAYAGMIVWDSRLADDVPQTSAAGPEPRASTQSTFNLAVRLIYPNEAMPITISSNSSFMWLERCTFMLHQTVTSTKEAVISKSNQ